MHLFHGPFNKLKFLIIFVCKINPGWSNHLLSKKKCVLYTSNYDGAGLSIRGGTRYFYLPKMVFGTS
jgi:hypothetical protein